jgi:glycylpeptide N-tetradecanoyltransferase
MSSGQAKEIIDTTLDAEHPSDDESDDGSLNGDQHNPAISTATSSSSKKKKKKKKISKILKSGLGGGSVSNSVVETVLEKVKAEHADADADVVRSALEQLNLKDVVAGKTGLGGKNKKDTGNHKVFHSCLPRRRVLSYLSVLV